MDPGLLHKALLQPSCYPEKPETVTHLETHISHLYFTNQHVYKIKKPVDFGFLNFTTLDRRRFYCEEEVRLNRRFCPDTYLQVAELRRFGNRIRIDGEGDIVDYAVVMRRLPADRMLDRLIESGAPQLPEAMAHLAAHLAALPSRAYICPGTGGRTDLETVQFNWQENFQQMAPFLSHPLSARGPEHLVSYVEHFFACHGKLILQREKKGFVRDGHGDLHAQNICFTEPICIYDCIEFNQRFRVADLAAEVAFLLMDLEFRSRRDLADRFSTEYLQHFENREEWTELLPFYKVYRAYVRGKVNTFLSADPRVPPQERTEGRIRAGRYFNLALSYLCRPAVILTCGLMGAGKTFVARPLAGCLEGELLRSDEVRKELAGLAPETKVAVPYQTGLYATSMTVRTYETLLERALNALRNGRTAVIDASFAKESQRERFRAAARQAKIPFLLVHMTCDREALLDRLAQRESRQNEASDGRRELLTRQEADFEPPEARPDTVRIDTLRDVDHNVHSVLCTLLDQEGKSR